MNNKQRNTKKESKACRSWFNILGFKKGFTLIELLVVISIIGILAALGTARYVQAEKNARDARRKSDINQYRIALENYANANNIAYPTASTITDLCGVGSFQTTYLSGECLNDPLSASGRNYLCFSNSLNYVLAAHLEKSSGTTYYVVCSNGRTGERTSAPTNANCPL